MSEQSERPGWLRLGTDVASYLMGVVLLAKQAGIFFSPPTSPNDMLILVGALLIGVPGIAQVIAWRFGSGGAGSTTEQPQSSSPAQPSSGQPLPSQSAGAE